MNPWGEIYEFTLDDLGYLVEMDLHPTRWGFVTRLRIWRRDEGTARDWCHLQTIKNFVAGPDRLAVELYPPDSALVDTWNCYHLWVLPEGSTLPFGYSQREVTA